MGGYVNVPEFTAKRKIGKRPYQVQYFEDQKTRRTQNFRTLSGAMGFMKYKVPHWRPSLVMKSQEVKAK